MFSWTLHQKGSPVQDEGVAVAVRHLLYYFGRNTDEKNKDQIDVQVFNTVSLLWRKLTPVTPGRGERPLEVPSRRYGHTAVLIEDIAYLWGGGEYGTSNHCNLLDAFDVDTHSWFKPQVSGTVPEGRRRHSACVFGKVMYVHGGYGQTGLTNDIYKLDTTTLVWSLINTRGTPPPDSCCHSATIIGTKMFVFGGFVGGGFVGGQWYNTIRVFDTETDCWLNTPSAQLLPERRGDPSASTYNGELYIYGGWNNEFFNDVWKFSPETFCWKKVEPKGKGPCPLYRMCCCMVGDRIFLFGGDNTPDDLYVLDLSPNLKTLCKLAVVQYGVEQSELPHNIRWELAAMNTTKRNTKTVVESN